MKERIVRLVLLLMEILLVIVIYCCSNTRKISPSEYLQKYSDIPVESIVAQQRDENFILLFFKSNQKIACAVLEITHFSYRMIGISNGLSPGANKEPTTKFSNYMVSEFTKGRTYYWIEWGILEDERVLCQLADEEYMNIIYQIPDGYRICWITGREAESIPSKHAEIVIAPDSQKDGRTDRMMSGEYLKSETFPTQAGNVSLL